MVIDQGVGVDPWWGVAASTFLCMKGPMVPVWTQRPEHHPFLHSTCLLTRLASAVRRATDVAAKIIDDARGTWGHRKFERWALT